METIRPIRKDDEAELAEVIRTVMSGYEVDLKNTIVGDPVLYKMYEAYLVPRSAYYIAESEGKILGGAGIKQLDGEGIDICELQRMFLLPEGRGHGLGQRLMELCLADARKFGYQKMYLESLDEMREAQKLYLRNGFKKIYIALGCTGHTACNLLMIKNL